MRRFIFIQFAFAAAIIGTIAVMLYMFHGWLGVVAYLMFAVFCLIPAILKAKSVLKVEKGGDDGETGCV